MKSEGMFQFGEFQIDVLARTLRREEEIVALNRRSFEVLLYLVQNPGRVLTRDELLKNVWSETFVDENSLAQSISALRRALEEKPGDNSYIVTLPGRGYQFVSPVQVVIPEVVAPGDGTAPVLETAGRSNSRGLIFQKHSVETSVIATNEAEEHLSSPTSSSRVLIRTVAVLLASVVVVVLVVRFRGPRHPEPKRELMERQLTANPPENRINSSALSRDGKYLAYCDSLSKDLYLLAIDSGEIREVPLPGDYAPFDWFPDGNHLLMSGHGNDLWKMSTWDFSLRKLWDGRAIFVALSPDGSHIAFVKDWHELWLMGEEGEEPQQIPVGDADGLSTLAWSPSGQRLAFMRYAKHDLTIETSDLAGGARTVLLSDPRLSGLNGESGIAWLPDGRILYSIFSGTTESNLWARFVDPRSGKPSGDATRLVGWKNFEARDPQASADGKRLVALRQHTENWIYVGDLANGNKAFTPHRFTADDWYNVAAGWTKDSKAIVFCSKRHGRVAIFKQDIDAKTPEALIGGPENYYHPRISAQGVVLYSAAASPDREEPGDNTVRLMSTPEQGGARTTLLKGDYDYECGSSPSSSCVVAEFADGHLMFFRLDPLKGKGEEIARIEGQRGYDARWGVSPDGAKIAIVDPTEHEGEIRILSLADRKVTV